MADDPIESYRARAHRRAHRIAVTIVAASVVPVVLEGMVWPAVVAVAANLMIFHLGGYAGIAASQPASEIKRYLDRR